MQCTPGLDDCGDSATCMEFPDGHRCVCNSGFTGDGVTRTGIYSHIIMTLCATNYYRICYFSIMWVIGNYF